MKEEIVLENEERHLKEALMDGGDKLIGGTGEKEKLGSMRVKVRRRGFHLRR